MIEPKRVLRALAEHWTLLEPLCERFDAGTLSLIELRHQLAAQLPEGTPTDITALLDQWIRLDILVPVAKSPNRFELNAQIHDFLAYLRREHRLGLCLEIEAYLRHLERLAGHIQDAFEIRDGQDLARQLRRTQKAATIGLYVGHVDRLSYILHARRSGLADALQGRRHR